MMLVQFQTKFSPFPSHLLNQDYTALTFYGSNCWNLYLTVTKDNLYIFSHSDLLEATKMQCASWITRYNYEYKSILISQQTKHFKCKPQIKKIKKVESRLGNLSAVTKCDLFNDNNYNESLHLYSHIFLSVTFMSYHLRTAVNAGKKQVSR